VKDVCILERADLPSSSFVLGSSIGKGIFFCSINNLAWFCVRRRQEQRKTITDTLQYNIICRETAPTRKGGTNGFLCEAEWSPEQHASLKGGQNKKLQNQVTLCHIATLFNIRVDIEKCSKTVVVEI